MTRLLYLPDDVSLIQLDVEINARQLAAAINAGLRPVPVLESITDKLIACQIGNTVIVSPGSESGRPTRLLLQGSLTPRQKQVLELASSGYSTSEIAKMMKISRRTVSYHLKCVKDLMKPHSPPPSTG